MTSAARAELKSLSRHVPRALFEQLPKPASHISVRRIERAVNKALTDLPEPDQSHTRRRRTKNTALKSTLNVGHTRQAAGSSRPDSTVSLDRALNRLEEAIRADSLGTSSGIWQEDGEVLELGHRILDTTNLDGPSTSTDALIFRQRVYEKVLSRFKGTHLEGRAISTYLARQIDSEVPVNSATIKQVFHYLLASPESSTDDLDSSALVQLVLPLLPPQIDLELFTMLMSTLVKTVSPKPAHLRNIVEDSLRSLGIEHERDWPWPLWNVMMQSYERALDMRGAVALLGRFRSTVEEARLHLPHITVASTTGGEPQRVRRGWTEAEAEQITAPFTTLMKLWSKEGLAYDSLARLRTRMGSKFPETIIHGLLQLLATPGSSSSAAAGVKPSVKLPAAFFTAWMNAERITGHTGRVFDIWRMITAGKGWQPDDAIIRKPDDPDIPAIFAVVDVAPVQPDVTTLSALFKTYRYMPSSPSPPREVLGLLCDLASKSTYRDGSATTAAFDALLSSVLMSPRPDLPLVLIVIDMMLGRGPIGQSEAPKDQVVQPSGRTIDLLAGSTLRLYRSGLAIFDKADDPNLGGVDGAERRQRLAARNGWSGLAMWEWEIVTRAVARMRLAEAAEDSSAPNPLDPVSARIELPVRKPLAKLDVTLDVSSNGSDTPSDPLVGSHTAAKFQETHRIVIPADRAHRSRSSRGVAGLSNQEVQSVLSALGKLYERAILLQSRLDPSWAGLDEEQVIREVKRQAYVDAFPVGRQAADAKTSE